MKIGGASKGLYVGYIKNRQQEEKDRVHASKLSGGREDIFVYSLKHGTGTTYLAAAIANYVAECGKSVTLVLSDTDYSDELVSHKVSVISWEEEPVRRTDYIVYDGGVYVEQGSVQNAAMRHASTRCLICQGDPAYLKRLAEYESDEKHPELKYLFNYVPHEWEPKILDVMDFTEDVYFIDKFYLKNANALNAELKEIVR